MAKGERQQSRDHCLTLTVAAIFRYLVSLPCRPRMNAAQVSETWCTDSPY